MRNTSVYVMQEKDAIYRTVIIYLIRIEIGTLADACHYFLIIFIRKRSLNYMNYYMFVESNVEQIAVIKKMILCFY